MTLAEAIARIDQLDEDSTILVRTPWAPDAEALVAPLTDGCVIPAEVSQAGYSYFLEVSVAREVLEGFPALDAVLEKRVRLLQHYAEFDAYPDWVYQA